MVIGKAITSFTNLDDIARFNFNRIGAHSTYMASAKPQLFSHSFVSYPSCFSSSSSSCSSSLLRPLFNRSHHHHHLYPFSSYNYFSVKPLLARSLDAERQYLSEGESPAHDTDVFTAQNDEASRKSKVTIIGSGNWGSVAAKLIASNTLKLSNFHDEVRMWVYEETVPSGEKLTDVINRTNENVKYLPGIKLGKNVVADPDLENAVRDANMLVFVTPHQFVEGICKRLDGKLNQGVEAISLIKGMEVKMEGPCMISSVISQQLNINCCVLMGANIAKEIAVEKFSEATVGYRNNREIAEKWVHLFSTPYFSVSPTEDVEGVELCGTLKNVVALAAGFVDGLEMGNNTKAAIMRLGLIEMKAFSKLLFSSVKDSTFLESCGVADLITTCLGGRNRKVAEAYARNGGKRSFDELEADMLQGQKLQGVLTSWEVYEVLRHRGLLQAFPLFSTVHEISTGRLPPSALVKYCAQKPGLSAV